MSPGKKCRNTNKMVVITVFPGRISSKEVVTLILTVFFKNITSQFWKFIICHSSNMYSGSGSLLNNNAIQSAGQNWKLTLPEKKSILYLGHFLVNATSASSLNGFWVICI